jgi:hypothetical protein
MRARNLKPGFFKNDLLSECDPLARILFAGLWCMADREGRMECHPKRIKAEVLPYDTCDVTKLLDQLRMKGFVVVYRYEDENYIEIPTFSQHQNCHIKEAASTIPAPDSNSSCTVAVGPLSSFLLPLTESPLPSTPKRGRAQVLNESKERFDKFWTEYPRKVAKGDAENAWAKINPSEHLTGEILSAVQRAKTSTDWLKDSGQYIPYPATWLNRKGWEDEFNADRPHAKEKWELALEGKL